MLAFISNLSAVRRVHKLKPQTVPEKMAIKKGEKVEKPFLKCRSEKMSKNDRKP